MPDTTPLSRSPSAIVIGAALLLSSVPASPATIPHLQATTFTGSHVDLPEALQGKLGIFVIGFTQASRDGVTAWGKKLAADFSDSPTIAYYEMPVLASVPKLLRGFVQSRIKAAVSDPGKPHFLFISEDESTWRSLVHYANPDTPYILVVDQQGTIRWQTEGPPTEATYTALKQQLATLRPHE